MKKRFFSLVMVFCVVWSTGFAQEVTGEDPVLKKTLEKLQNSKTFRLDFSQSTYIASMEETMASKGVLLYQSPSEQGRMPRIYLEYFEPKDERQMMVFDGKTLWVYRGGANQVVKQEVTPQQMKRNAMIFIPQWLDALFRRSTINFTGVTKNGMNEYQAMPKSSEHEMFKKVELVIEPESGDLKRYVMTDLNDNLIEVNVEKADYDLKIEDEKFVFKKPEGAEVIENSQNGAFY